MAQDQVTFTLKIQGAAQGFINAARAAATALKPLDDGIKRTSQSFDRLGSKANIFNRQAAGAKNLGSSYKGLIGQVTSMNRGFNILASSIRQVGQGLQNFGTTMSIFVSLPIGAFIRSSTKDALAFNNAMIEVRKTTGLAGAELETLSGNLRKISLESPTDPKVLAEIAASWGRMGVSGEDALSTLTRVTDQLQIATTLTADQAVTELGRIGNIMYSTTEEFVQNYEKLGSAINELGQANAVTENEIVAAALRMAPAMKSLGFSIEELLAVATTAASTNASAERAGTQTAAAITKTAIELEKISELTGETTDTIIDMLRTDAEGFFLDLVYSISEVEDPLKKIIASTEIFGVTGAKSVQSLAAAFPVLGANLAIANKAYEDGVSLQLEYNRALDSVSTQMGILRNNVRYLATDVANTLLPYMTKFAALAIPVIQVLIGLFEGLNERTRFLIIGVGLLLTVAGPLLVALGSIGFAVGIIATGMSAFVTSIFTAISSVIGFAGTIIGLLAPFKSMLLIVAAATAAVFAFSTQLGQVSSLVQKYIAAAYNWGYNLIASFASGIASAAALIYNTMVSVINSFIGLIQAFSPPREGPLRNVTTWGKNTMQAFVDGMADVNIAPLQRTLEGMATTLRGLLESFSPSEFSTFNDLWGTFESTISTVARSIGLAGNDLKNFLGGAAKNLAEVVTMFNSGMIETAVGAFEGLRGVLGEFTGDMEKLVDLQMQYAALESEIADIEHAVRDVNNAYKDQLGLIAKNIDLTANQRSAMIRQLLMQRAIAGSQLEDKKDQLESIGDEIDQRKGIVSILTSLLPDPAAAGGGAGGATGSIKEAKEDVEDLMTALGSFDLKDASDALNELGEGALADLKDKFEDAGEGAETFIDKIQRGRDVVAGFIAALRGDEFTPEQLTELGEGFNLGFEKGAEIRATVLDFLTQVNGYYLKWLGFVAFLSGAFILLKSAIKEAMGLLDVQDILALESLVASYGKFGNAIRILGNVIGTVADKLVEMGDAFINNLDPDGSLKAKIEDLQGPLTAIAEALGGIALLVFDNMDELAGAIGTLVGHLSEGLLNLLIFAGIISELVLISAGAGDVERLAASLESLSEGAGALAAPAAGTIDNIKGIIEVMLQIKEVADKLKPSDILPFNQAIFDLTGALAQLASAPLAGPLKFAIIANWVFTKIKDAIDVFNSLQYAENETIRTVVNAIRSLGAIPENVRTSAKNTAEFWYDIAKKIKDSFDLWIGQDGSSQGKVKGHAKMVIETQNSLATVPLAIANRAITIVDKFKTLIDRMIGAASSITSLPEVDFSPVRNMMSGIGNIFGNIFGGSGQDAVDVEAPDLKLGSLESSAEEVGKVTGVAVQRGLKTQMATGTTYDPIADNLALWAQGEGATLIEESALSLATAFGVSIEAALSGNTLFWQGLITSFETWWEEVGLTWATEEVGTIIFTTINDTMYLLFSEMLPTFEQIMIAAKKWYAQKRQAIVNFGKQVGETVTEGIKEIFADADDYMNVLLNAMNDWIEANKDAIKDVGKAIGEIIGDGIIEEIEDALDDLIDKYKNEIDPPGGNQRVAPGTSAASIPFGNGVPYTIPNPPAPSNNVNIQVDVSGHVRDEETAAVLAEEIYRRMALDMRYN